jgi:integrase
VEDDEPARRDSGLAPLEPIGLHEARHTFASLMIAAGVNEKALSSYMGHASVTMTLDRYGRLMPGTRKRRQDFWTGTWRGPCRGSGRSVR